MLVSNAEDDDKWDISAFRLITGIIVGVIVLAVAFGAQYAVGYLNSRVHQAGNGLTLSSNLLSFVGGDLFLGLVVALVVIRIAHNTIRKPLTVRGPLKAVLGALTGVFYYLLVAGGTISVLIGFSPTSVSGTVALSITLLVTLVFLELSCGMKVIQGVLEYREGRAPQAVVPLTTSPSPEVPPSPPTTVPQQ